jgi:hypothetical protein
MAHPLLQLIETMSRQLSQTKPEMDASLRALRDCAVSDKLSAQYISELESALLILRESNDVPDFLRRLGAESEIASTSPLRAALGSFVGYLSIGLIALAWFTHIVMAAIQGKWWWMVVGLVTPIGPVVGFSWWWTWLVQYLRH